MKCWVPVYEKPKRVWDGRRENHNQEARELEKRSNLSWPGAQLYSLGVS